jgi:hypothetical protein
VGFMRRYFVKRSQADMAQSCKIMYPAVATLGSDSLYPVLRNFDHEADCLKHLGPCAAARPEHFNNLACSTAIPHSPLRHPLKYHGSCAFHHHI